MEEFVIVLIIGTIVMGCLFLAARSSSRGHYIECLNVVATTNNQISFIEADKICKERTK